jgi:ABC-type transport system involved in multi-copper enzyme maturation permease subunit
VLLTIIRKELLSHIVTFRFVTGFILCALLVPISAHVLTRDYVERLDVYSLSSQAHRSELDSVQVYSELKVTIDRKPSVLSILCAGLEKQLGNTVTIHHGEVPAIAGRHGRSNPLLVAFPEMDIATIAMVVFSLLSVLFAYDTISSEREDGTLAQVLSNPIPRARLLLGKYIGGILPLSILVVFSLLVGLLVMSLSPSVRIEWSDWPQVLLIVCVILIYSSAFYTLGVLLSVICGRSATALMLLLFLWVLLVVVVPASASYIASRIHAAPLEGETELQSDRVWDQFDEEAEKIRSKYPGRGWTFGSRFDEHVVKVYDGDREGMLDLLEQRKRLEPLRIRYADRAWQVYQSYYDQLYEQSMLARNLSRISPAAAFYNVAAALAGTDVNTHLAFLKRARQYRDELITYMRAKDAFNSLVYFTRKTMDELRTKEELKAAMMRNEDIEGRGWDAIPPLDLGDLPRFNQHPAAVSASVEPVLVDLVLLVVLNVIFFILAYMSFLKGPVK